MEEKIKVDSLAVLTFRKAADQGPVQRKRANRWSLDCRYEYALSAALNDRFDDPERTPPAGSAL